MPCNSQPTCTTGVSGEISTSWERLVANSIASLKHSNSNDNNSESNAMAKRIKIQSPMNSEMERLPFIISLCNGGKCIRLVKNDSSFEISADLNFRLVQAWGGPLTSIRSVSELQSRCSAITRALDRDVESVPSWALNFLKEYDGIRSAVRESSLFFRELAL